MLHVIVDISCSDTEFGDESDSEGVEEVYSVSEQLESKEEEVGGGEEKEGGADHEAGDDKESSDSDTDDLAKLVETLQSVVDSGSEQEALSYNVPFNVSLTLGSAYSRQLSSVFLHLASLSLSPSVSVR